MEDLVSIITPLYNAESTIAETIESVLAQTYQNWEMIIVDDCSTDKSFEIASRFSEKDKRINVVKLDKNGGTAVARNEAIKRAKGKYIAFLDADDLWKPEKLSKQIAFMNSNGYRFTYCNYDVLKENGSIREFKPKRSSLTYKVLLKRNDIGCLTAIYNAKEVGKVYMPLDSRKREEYAAWLDILKQGIIAYKLDENLATYRLLNSSLTASKKKMIRYHYRVYRKHEGFGITKSLYLLFTFMANKILTKYK